MDQVQTELEIIRNLIEKSKELDSKDISNLDEASLLKLLAQRKCAENMLFNHLFATPIEHLMQEHTFEEFYTVLLKRLYYAMKKASNTVMIKDLMSQLLHKQSKDISLTTPVKESIDSSEIVSFIDNIGSESEIQLPKHFVLYNNLDQSKSVYEEISPSIDEKFGLSGASYEQMVELVSTTFKNLLSQIPPMYFYDLYNFLQKDTPIDELITKTIDSFKQKLEDDKKNPYNRDAFLFLAKFIRNIEVVISMIPDFQLFMDDKDKKEYDSILGSLDKNEEKTKNQKSNVGALMYDKSLTEDQITDMMRELLKNSANADSRKEYKDMNEFLYRKKKSSLDASFRIIEKRVKEDPTLLDYPIFSAKYVEYERLSYDCAINTDVVSRLSRIRKASREIDFMLSFVGKSLSEREENFEHFEGCHEHALEEINSSRKEYAVDNAEEIRLIESEISLIMKRIQKVKRENPAEVAAYQSHLVQKLETLYLRKQYSLDVRTRQLDIELPADYEALNDDNIYVRNVATRLANIKDLEKKLDDIVDMKKTENILKENETAVKETVTPVIEAKPVEKPIEFTDYANYTTTGRIR